MYAILSGNVEGVRLLLNHGADPETRLFPPNDHVHAIGSARALADRKPEASREIVDKLMRAVERKTEGKSEGKK